MRNERKANSGVKGALIALAVTPVALWPQTPVVSSFVNAASYQATFGPPGTIATIFGTNLASTTAVAQAEPLPLRLAGTSVTVGGFPAALFYVSPTQINFQTPGEGSVVVTTNAGSSAPYDPTAATPDVWTAGGIFTVDASGCGRGAVLNVAADGSVSVNSPANSASPGDWISVFGTGMEDLNDDPLGLGVAAPASPLISQCCVGVGFQFDSPDAENANAPAVEKNTASAAWAGLAPGFVALEQANVQIPLTVPEGCAVPLQAVYNNPTLAITQPVAIAVRQGGGACIDPPAAGYGQITWEKTTSTTYLNVVSESDTLTASLQAAPGKQAPPAPDYIDACPPPSVLCGLPGPETLFGPACAIPGYRSLGAGTVTMQGSGLSLAQVPSLPFQLGQLGGLSAYQAALPAGTIQAGNFSVKASGGADVGAFQASMQLGADIQLQTPLAALAVFYDCQPLTIGWTGGDPNSWVTSSLVFQRAGSDGAVLSYQTRTSNLAMTIPVPFQLPCAPGGSAVPIEIVIEVDPDPSDIAIFSASGLSLGGQMTWRYIHTFQAMLQ